MWRADFEKTLLDQQARIDASWDRLRRLSPVRRATFFNQNYTTLYQDDHFFEQLSETFDPIEPQAGLGSPLQTLGSSREYKTFKGASERVAELVGEMLGA